MTENARFLSSEYSFGPLLLHTGQHHCLVEHLNRLNSTQPVRRPEAQTDTRLNSEYQNILKKPDPHSPDGETW